MYLLDTNICIELLAGDRRVIEQLASLQKVHVYISAVTVAELVYGAMRSTKPDYEKIQIKRLTDNFVVLPINTIVAVAYGKLKAELASRGQLLEDNDLYIGATALSRGFILVTHDKGFSRITSLELED